MARTNLLRASGAAFLLATSIPALAQNQQPQPTAPRQAADPNQIICEKVKELGSRLSMKKICMTRAEWAERRLVDRQDLERTQVQRGYGRGN